MKEQSPVADAAGLFFCLLFYWPGQKVRRPAGCDPPVLKFFTNETIIHPVFP
jgi:hypothetical protein